MSDFDKEAERERLREKYEKDQAEREATQRMSDLLLKGARMTNTHCNTCGDPLFQMNGTTFCPTCHGGPGAVEGTDLAADEGGDASGETPPADASGGAAQSDASGDAAPTDARDGSHRGRAPSSSDVDRTDRERANAGRDAADAGDATAASETTRGIGVDETTPNAGTGSPDAADPAEPTRPPAETPSAPRAPDAAPVEGSLESARESLRRALERFAREAAETDDPRYARDCLEAAREAADALAALRRGS